MAQFARPSTDTTRTNWTDQADGTTNIFQAIDEVTASDTDFTKTPAPPGTNVFVTKVTAVTDPESSSAHVVRWRRSRYPTGSAGVNLTVELRQGYVSEASQGTLIKSQADSAIPDAFGSTSMTLSTAEADAITDYSDLYLRFVATAA